MCFTSISLDVSCIHYYLTFGRQIVCSDVSDSDDEDACICSIM